MADIVYASGAVHDVAGPVTCFAPMTEAGRAWLEANGAIGGSYVVETYLEDLTIGCIEGDGLTVAVA